MKSLKNSTAVLMGLSLLVPHGGFAAGHVTLDTCGDTVEPPCVLDDTYVVVEAQGQGSITIEGLGTTEVKVKDLELCPAEMVEEAAPCMTAEGDALFALDGAEMMALLGSEALMEEATETEEVEGAADAGGDAVEGDGAAEGGTDVAEVEEVPAETEMAESDGEAEVETEMASEAEVAPEADTEMAAETESETDMAAETEMAVETETETEMTAETEMAADGETTIEEDTTAKTVEAPAAGDETTEMAETPGEGEGVTEMVETETAETIVVEEAPAAAAAADTGGEGATSAEAEVEVEEVTEENSRAADEDFATSAAGGEASGSAAASASADGDDGLSKFEKALILGLGAVVVGQALNTGEEVVSNSGDRVVVKQDDGTLRVLKDDDALLRQPGSQVQTETFSDGSTRTTVTREDGTKIVTIRAADGRVVRRARVFDDGSQIVLFDDTEAADPVDVSELPDIEEETIDLAQTDEDALRAALAAAQARELNRGYSLRQIRQIRQVRALAPQIELDAITFATGSAAIQPNQTEELRALGNAMADIIEERPGEVFLIEGHTDTVGSDSLNLALSDRRAETVALALSQYFGVPPENMITQGYGESQLKIRQEGDIRENRRAVIRRITPLLRTASAN